MITQVKNMEKDEISFEDEQIMTDNYKQLQAKSFADLETNAKDWKMCEIKGVFGPFVDYKIPDDYEHRQTEISKKLNKIVPGQICGQQHCELCGYPIKYIHFIQNDFKNLYLAVGSVCVNSFMGAKFVTKYIKHFKDNEIRKEFIEWNKKTLEILSVQYEMFNGKPKIHYYTKKPIMRYWAWKMQEKLKKTDPETTTSLKLKNLMKKCKENMKLNVRKEVANNETQ